MTTSHESADGTWVLGQSGSITDALGEKWTLTNNWQVSVNGNCDIFTGYVFGLYYHDHAIYQANTNHHWYVKTSSKGTWKQVACPIPHS